MVASKVEDTFKTWVESLNIQAPHQLDNERLYELAYQIYLAKQLGDKDWAHQSGGQWLAQRLAQDGRFSNQQISRYSYMVDDLINYNFWLLKRNSEA